MPLAPTRIVSATAARYIAGETLADALRTAADLSKRGALSTLDILGEAVTDSATADATLQGYLDALEALVEARLDPHISIKPSALGAATDWSACRERVREIVRAALPHSGIVNIDMEDSTTTEGTIVTTAITKTKNAHTTASF